MLFSLAQIIQWLVQYKYFIFFPAVIIEGPIVTIIGGFLASIGVFNIFVIYLVAIFGDLVGDALYYSLGRWGGRSLINRWGSYLGITKDKLNNLEDHFKKHSGKTILLGKLTHAVGGVILIVAGIAEMPFWKFIRFNLLGTIPKSLILILIGYYFGQAYNRLNRYLDYTALATLALASLFIIIYFLIKKLSKKLEG